MAVRRKKTSKAAPNLLEKDLYGPIRDFLVEQGYTVRSEVKYCDITATKNDDLVVIELKRGFSTDLLIQATQRQRASDSVYVALPRPKGSIYAPRWRGMLHLLKRLELGLLLVNFLGGRPVVEVVFHPVPSQRKKSRGARRAILQEIADRSGDYNTGGSTRRKIVTAYRETAIRIACYLDTYGQMSPAKLRELGAGPKTQSILYSNFYGWFDRVGHGVYTLNATGKAALTDYPDLVARFRRTLQKRAAVRVDDALS